MEMGSIFSLDKCLCLSLDLATVGFIETNCELYVIKVSMCTSFLPIEDNVWCFCTNESSKKLN